MHNHVDAASTVPLATVNGQAEHASIYHPPPAPEGPKIQRVPEGDIQVELAKIEASMQQENGKLANEDDLKRDYIKRGQKRILNVESGELLRRKVSYS